MARKTEVLVVDDTKYQVTQLTTTEGADLYEELLRIVGPSLKDASFLAGEAPETAVLRVMLGSIGSLPRGMVNRMGKLFAKHSKVQATMGAAETAIEFNDAFYDEHFAGRMGHLTRWIMACLRFNFSDFLPSAAGSGGTSGAGANAKK